jgi:hypothetical protein
MPRPNDRTVTTDPRFLAAFDRISYSYDPIYTFQPENNGNGSGTIVIPDDDNEETKKDKTFFEKYQVPIILAGSVLVIGFAYFALFARKK